MNEGTPPGKTFARRAAAAAPGLPAVLVLASLDSFVFTAVNVSGHDPYAYGSRPLGSYPPSVPNVLLCVPLVLGILSSPWRPGGSG